MRAPAGRSWWALGGRREPVPAGQHPDRPEGPLVWLHVAGPASASGLRELAARLREEQGVAVLMTGARELLPDQGVLRDQMPEESLGDLRSFLTHWSPDAVVLSEGEIRPALLGELAEREIPVLIADAREPWLAKGSESWIPGVMRRSLVNVHRVFAIDAAAGRAFQKAGAQARRISVSGRLEESSQALPCLEAEREYLADLTVARPVWFAGGVPQAEEDAVMAAHRHALQLAHRLLLVLMPEDPARAGPLARELEEQGFSVSVRSDEQEPDPEIEVYIVAEPAELGLWYRLAPITYIGGGLSGTGLTLNPFAPAALGSALLHGPRPGSFGAPLGRLGAARAARAVASIRDLSEALADLLSPERSARLAGAAWGVVSEGAEVTEDMLKTLAQLIAERQAATGGGR